jgi:nitroreductase
MMKLLCCCVGLASSQFAPLLDHALKSVRSLNTLSAAEEEAAVRRLLQQDERLLLLAKHFGAAPGFEGHLRAALGPDASSTVCPPAPPSASILSLRRSVKAYKPDGPVPPEAVDRALEAAVLAPNHFLTQPWRYYLLGGETKAKLLKLNEKKAEEFKAVPGWMVVTIATEYDSNGLISTKKGLEDHAACAAAIQNFMLSLSAEGYGSKWMTGALGMPPDAILDAIGADKEAERFMGVIWHGVPAEPLEAHKLPPRTNGVPLTRLA